jgi:hypothetical protein
MGTVVITALAHPTATTVGTRAASSQQRQERAERETGERELISKHVIASTFVRL